MLAGGVGGSTGDMLMHSIDTVKTRQQGDLSLPSRYPASLPSSYRLILSQEGLARGLYAGVTPAFLGSFPGTIIFFGCYEASKRCLLDRGVNPSLAYLASGFIADLAASVLYVPSEVLKTRLQLQGRYNNPWFHSGYNYRGTLDAARTIVRQEGISALFYGYKATIWRDLPFSALQFAFYEQEQEWAREYKGSRDIGLGLEIATAAPAGGMAGTITCPLDVVKTRIQTQVNPVDGLATPSSTPSLPTAASSSSTHASGRPCPTGPSAAIKASNPIRNLHSSPPPTIRPSAAQSPSTSMNLPTSSILRGLNLIYKTEGIAGLFRGVGPRAVWTSVQSGTMLVLYQALLRKMAVSPFFSDEREGARVA